MQSSLVHRTNCSVWTAIISVAIITLFLFSVSPAVSEAATVTMTKANTGYAKNFYSQYYKPTGYTMAGNYVNTNELNYYGYNDTDMKRWCKDPEAFKMSPSNSTYQYSNPEFFKYLTGSSGSTFDILAWCVANNVITKAVFSNSPYNLGVSHRGGTACKNVSPYCGIQVYTGATTVTYSHQLLSKTSQLLAVRGTQGSEAATPGTFVMTANSPFIYFKNPPKSPVTVKLSSLLNQYTPKPAFTSEYAWTDTFTNESELFYELQIPAITLSRAGQNFSSKAELVAYLEQGDFFDRMHFTELQKQNSLGYIVPKIPTDSPNYYLTILSPESIADISQLDISFNPVMERNFFAIYPSAVSVATTDALQFPEGAPQSDAFTVTELGEVLVDSMVINWTE